MWRTTLPSSSDISRVPSSRLLKRSSPWGFHVRNCRATDMRWWAARPGSWRKLVALKKTGKECVSTQEKERLRCEHGNVKREKERGGGETQSIAIIRQTWIRRWCGINSCVSQGADLNGSFNETLIAPSVCLRKSFSTQIHRTLAAICSNGIHNDSNKIPIDRY